MRIGSIETSAFYDTLRQEIKDAINEGEPADEIIDLIDSVFLNAYQCGSVNMFEKMVEKMKNDTLV